MKIKRIISYIPLIIWMAVIFLFSAQTSENSSETSSLPAAILARIINPDFELLNETDQTALIDKCQFAVRKLAHFSVYTVLGTLALFALSFHEKLNAKKRILFSSLILSLIHI